MTKNTKAIELKFYIFLLRSIPDKQAGSQDYFSGRKGIRGYLEQMNEKSWKIRWEMEYVVIGRKVLSGKPSLFLL